MRQTIQVNDNTVAGRAGQKIAALVYGIPWGISSNMLSPSSVLTSPEFSKAMVDGGRTVGGRGGIVASVDAVPLACEVARGPSASAQSTSPEVPLRSGRRARHHHRDEQAQGPAAEDAGSATVVGRTGACGCGSTSMAAARRPSINPSGSGRAVTSGSDQPEGEGSQV